MTTDQLIQLGILVVTSVPLVGIITRNIYNKRFALHLDVKPTTYNGGYISGITVSKNDNPYVSELAIWSNLTIINNSTQNIILKEIQTVQTGQVARSTIMPLFKHLSFHFQREVPAEAITLPVVIAPKAVFFCWVLLKVQIPPAVGRVLYQTYGSAAAQVLSKNEILKNIEEFEEHITTHVTKRMEEEMPFVSLKNLNLGPITSNDPILVTEGASVTFQPRFGLVPHYANSKELNDSIRSLDSSTNGKSTEAEWYTVLAIFADNRSLSCKFSRQKDPLWFFSSEYSQPKR